MLVLDLMKQTLISESTWTADEIAELFARCTDERADEEGERAEELLVQFNDSMISADISVPENSYIEPDLSKQPLPMAMRSDDPDIDLDKVVEHDHLTMRVNFHCRTVLRFFLLIEKS